MADTPVDKHLAILPEIRARKVSQQTLPRAHTGRNNNEGPKRHLLDNMRRVVRKSLIADSHSRSSRRSIPVTVTKPAAIRSDAADVMLPPERDQEILVHQRRVGPAVDEEKGWEIGRCCGFVIAVEELRAIDRTVYARHFGRWVIVVVYGRSWWEDSYIGAVVVGVVVRVYERRHELYLSSQKRKFLIYLESITLCVVLGVYLEQLVEYPRATRKNTREAVPP